VIVVAGDVRAVELMEEHLPDRLVHQVREIPVGRAAGVDDQAMDAETARWVADAGARSTVAILEKFREERGQGDRAVEGIAATLRALNEARVEVLLFHDDWNDHRQAVSSRDGSHVAESAGTLRDAFAITDTREGRLVDVALAAAFATGAAAWAVPTGGGPNDGIGALLRWA
jgi:peptide subunit release factor 1 (eRF1)